MSIEEKMPKAKKNDELNSDKLSVLREIGITKAQVMRTIEHLKAAGEELSPGTIAAQLGIPRAFLYSDMDLLEDIYRYCPRPIGPDKVIQDIMSALKSKERKIKKLEKLNRDLEEAAEKNFTDGFAKGAAMNFRSSDSQTVSVSTKDPQKDFMSFLKQERKTREAWAKGVLGLDISKDYDKDEVKKAYRKLVQLMHPDKSGDNELFHFIGKAYEILT